MSPARLIGNFAALLGAVVVAAFLFDRFVAWMNWKPWGLCYLMGPVADAGSAIGLLFTTVGLIVLSVSAFKSQKGLGLTVGGVLMSLVPMTMAHYLGASCIP
jgi:hypothetical protein